MCSMMTVLEETQFMDMFAKLTDKVPSSLPTALGIVESSVCRV